MSGLTKHLWPKAIAMIAAASAVTVQYSQAARLEADHHQVNPSESPHYGQYGAKVKALADRARGAYIAQDYVTAIALYGKLVRARPKESVHYYNRGNAFYAAHDMPRAIADYTNALSLNPNSYLALMGRGNALSQSLRFSEAISNFDRALELNPDEFLIWYNRGIAKGRTGDKTGALRDLTEAIKQRPNDHQSYAARGDIFASQGDAVGARADYRRALELNSADEHAAKKLKEFDGAIVEATNPGTDASATAQRRNSSGAEQIANLAVDACFKNGADEAGLRSMAELAKWKFVGDHELKKRSNMAASMIGGWTFDGETGAFAIIQSRENVTPAIHICSVTTTLGASARFGDVKTAFETTTGLAVSDVNASAGSQRFGYWLRHTPDCESRISLVHTAHSDIVTVRILHGRVRGANSGDQSYPNMGTQ